MINFFFVSTLQILESLIHVSKDPIKKVIILIIQK